MSRRIDSHPVQSNDVLRAIELANAAIAAIQLADFDAEDDGLYEARKHIEAAREKLRHWVGASR